MIENLSAEELATRLEFASKVFGRAARQLRSESIDEHDFDKLSAGFQRQIKPFIEAVDHICDRIGRATNQVHP